MPELSREAKAKAKAAAAKAAGPRVRVAGGATRHRTANRRKLAALAAQGERLLTLALLDAGVLHDATVRRLRAHHGFA